MDFMKRLVLLIEVSGSSLDRANNNMARRKTWLVFTPFFFSFLEVESLKMHSFDGFS